MIKALCILIYFIFNNTDHALRRYTTKRSRNYCCHANALIVPFCCRRHRCSSQQYKMASSVMEIQQRVFFCTVVEIQNISYCC